MRLALMVALAVIGLTAPAAQAADWTTYRYPDLGFSAAFPMAPTRLSKPADTSAGPVPTEYVYAKDGETLYFTSSSDISGQPEAIGAPDAAARGILDGALQTGTVVSPAAHLPVAAAWEGTTRTTDRLLRVRTYVRGKHGYTVMIIAPLVQPERVSDAAAMRFFGGFVPDAK
jgi:hypothetical protein